MYAKGGSAADLHPSILGIGTHQDGDPVPQVSDLIKVPVLGGVTGQLTQFLGRKVGAEGTGGVQGRVPDRGALDRVTGGHRETGLADRLGEGVMGLPGRRRGESVDGFAGVAAQYRQVEQGLLGELGVARGVIAGPERRLIVGVKCAK
jgi:hypothetical protein